MIDIPLNTIIEKIKQGSSLTDEDIKAKIKKKLDELSGLISEEGAARIVANELSIKLVETNGQVTIDKVLAGMRNLELIGKVRQVYEVREFKSETRSGKVGSFLLADPTGVIRIVLWNNQADKLKELTVGDVIKLKGVNARDNNGRIEIHVGDTANLYQNPEGVTVDVDITAAVARPAATTKKIAELTEDDQNVSVIATIVQVFDPRFFPVCPECNTRAREEEGAFTCATHGSITPQYNYVLNLYLDDGSDNIRCVLWREQIDALLNQTREEVIVYKDNPAAFEEQKTKFYGMIVKVRGRVNKNETFGRLELVGYEVAKDVDPAAEMGEQAAPATEEKPAATAPKPEEKPAIAETKTPETPKPTPAAPTEAPAEKKEELFTLDDIEDLEDLDE